jgi:hypothetical protein
MKNKSKQRSFAPAGPKKTEPISQLEGYLDVVHPTTVGGWAWNPSQPDRPAKVEIYDGTTLLATVTAADFREDLRRVGRGDGKHGFSYALPEIVHDGKAHEIHAKFVGADAELIGSPKTITCPKS